jgi:hypothetical protein
MKCCSQRFTDVSDLEPGESSFKYYPQNNGGVTVAKEVLTGVRKIVQEVVTPGFNDLKTEVRVNRTKQEESEKRLNDKMDSIKSELRSEMTSNKNEIKAEIRALSER